MRAFFLTLLLLGTVYFYVRWERDENRSLSTSEVELKRSQVQKRARLKTPVDLGLNAEEAGVLSGAGAPQIKLPVMRELEREASKAGAKILPEEDRDFEGEGIAARPAPRGTVGKSSDEEASFDEASIDDGSLINQFPNGKAPEGQRFGNNEYTEPKKDTDEGGRWQDPEVEDTSEEQAD